MGNCRARQCRALCADMDTPAPPAPSPVPAPVLAEDLIYELLAHPGRRAILRRMSQGGSFAAGDLAAAGPLKRDAMGKQLALLADAGILTSTKDPRFRRRFAYTLVPGITGRKTDAGWEMDFGCCVMRWR